MSSGSISGNAQSVTGTAWMAQTANEGVIAMTSAIIGRALSSKLESAKITNWRKDLFRFIAKINAIPEPISQ